MKKKKSAKPKGKKSTKAKKDNILADSSLISYMADIGAEENKPLKVSTLVSIIIHIFLLWIVLPESNITVEEGEVKLDKTVVIQRFKPPDPPKQEPKQTQKKIKTRKATVPIPDPTPDDPEVEREYSVVDEQAAPSTDVVDFDIALPANPPGPLRVGGDVKAPIKTKEVPPVYPELARKARIQGLVILEAIIDKKGNVVKAKVLRSPGAHFGFDQAAIKAVEKWKFKPGTQNGKPVDVIFTLTVRFVLE